MHQRPASRKARQGFTLIELLVVVVIIGILASIAMPSFVGAQDKARNSSLQGNVNVVRVAVEGYSGDHNGNPPSLEQCKLGAEDPLQSPTYLPGGKLPRSPWGKESPNAMFAPFNSGKDETTPGALYLAVGKLSLPGHGTRFPEPIKGTVSDPPKKPVHFGALLYDVDPESGTYVIYGMGKHNGELAVAGAASNNAGSGQSAVN